MGDNYPMLETFQTEEALLIHKDHFSLFAEAVNDLITICQEKTESREVHIDPELLSYEGEPAPLFYFPSSSKSDFRSEFEYNNRSVIPNNNLKTLIRRNKRDLNFAYLKYEVYQFLPMPFKLLAQPPNFKELMFTVKVYRPFIASEVRTPKILQQIQMLGRNTLQNLQNLIKCNIDYCGLKDVSEDIGKGSVGAVSNDRKQQYPSTFFFINKTFHCDTRFLVDLTGKVREWLAKYNIPTSEIPHMDSSLEDLQLQVGKPYLYQHQGNCEHIIMFSDVKCCSNVDSKDLSNFPFVDAISSAMIRHCMLCGISHARWLVMNCMKLTIARAYLCHRCLLSYCYIDGRKTGQFQVYHYVDAAAILP